MVLIPAGPFLAGTTPEQAGELAKEHGYHRSWFAGELPQRRLDLPAYWIDKLPVTNRDFADFCRETGHPPRPHWRGRMPAEGILDHPVTFVNRADAEAYARWAKKRLPTEAEWEKAARGTDGRMFPWGDRFDPEACTWNRDRRGDGIGTTSVTARPRGVSPFEVWDLVGNAAEWCSDGPGPGAAYIKGGSFICEEVIHLRPADRTLSGFANNAAPFYGFRCARDAATGGAER
jgi:formylglycine-generating enzyme required for sulfatase activity